MLLKLNDKYIQITHVPINRHLLTCSDYKQLVAIVLSRNVNLQRHSVLFHLLSFKMASDKDVISTTSDFANQEESLLKYIFLSLIVSSVESICEIPTLF